MRRIRVAQAGNRLTEDAASVTQAALDAGYDSTQRLARAFRDLSGLSPIGFQRAANADHQPPSWTLIE